MATVDTRYQASTARMIAKASGGAQVTFQRVTGEAPNATTQSATVVAFARGYQPDPTIASQQGLGSSEVGSLAFADRTILVMASDLAAQGFPLPMIKGDIAVLDTGETLTLVRVDSAKRAIAGCIEAFGVGV